MAKKLDLPIKEVATLYREGETLSSIGEMFGCSPTPISRCLREAGIPKRKSGKPNIKTEDIVLLYKKGMSSTKIGEHLNCSERMILGRLHKAGVELRQAGQQPCSVEEDKFDIVDTEAKAYWIGFLFADGCIHFPNRTPTPRIALGISTKDEQHLIKFKEFLQAGNEITRYRTMSKLAITNEHLCQSLIKIGVTPRKSNYCYGLPIVPDSLKNHMVRGVFDGDGHISIRRSDMCPKIHFVGHQSWIKDVREEFDPICVKHPMLESAYAAKDNDIVNIRYGSRADAIAICHYLYDNASVYLERKKAIADEVISRWDGVEYGERL